MFQISLYSHVMIFMTVVLVFVVSSEAVFGHFCIENLVGVRQGFSEHATKPLNVHEDWFDYHLV